MVDSTATFNVDGFSGNNGVSIADCAAVDWALGLGDRFDLRLGVGAQYIWIDTSTPFATIDAAVGFRL